MRIITQEVRKEIKSKIKIPNACDGLGLPYMNTYEMLRKERAMFVVRGSMGPLKAVDPRVAGSADGVAEEKGLRI